MFAKSTEVRTPELQRLWRLIANRTQEHDKVYRGGLAIAERLAAADPSNTQWQRDLLVSYERIGSVLVAQGKLDEALRRGNVRCCEQRTTGRTWQYRRK
jgi:hypothetical protein